MEEFKKAMGECALTLNDSELESLFKYEARASEASAEEGQARGGGRAERSPLPAAGAAEGASASEASE
jgi:hypothetical protein